MIKSCRLYIVCLIIFLSAIINANPVDDQIKKELKDGMFLGCVVMAGQPDSIYYHKAFGRRDVGLPMKVDCLFDLASVTKVTSVATALAITMHNHPEMSLNDLMSTYLPGMTGTGSGRITIRHTATHTSGLDNHKYSADITGEERMRYILARNQNRALLPLGEKWKYSCLGMIRMSEMIASINNMEFGEFCRREIFEPMGMNDTRFCPITDPELKMRCIKTEKPLGVIRTIDARSIGRPVGNAGLFSTAFDLSKMATLWLQKGRYENKRYFSESLYQEFTRKQTSAAEWSIVWKVGNTESSGLSERTFFHTGYTGQSVWIDPINNCYVIVLTIWTHPVITAGDEESDQSRERIAKKIMETFKFVR